MKKRISSTLKGITSLVLCAAMLFIMGAVPKTQASSLSDLKKEYAALAQKIAQSEKVLNSIKSKKGAQKAILENLNAQINAIDSQIEILNSQIGILNGQVGGLNTKIAGLDTEIKTLDTQINTAQTQITDKQKSVESTTEMMLERLRADYIAGSSSEIEILLSSKDLSTFLTRTEMLKQVTDNDNRLVKSLKADMAELKNMTTALQSDKAKLLDKEKTIKADRAALIVKKNDVKASAAILGSKQAQVISKYADTKAIIATLDKSSQLYIDQINNLERKQAKIDKAIDAYILAHMPGGNVGGTGKMVWPVDEPNTYISSPYGWRTLNGKSNFHSGIDITCHHSTDSKGNFIYNKKIVAAQSGIVIDPGEEDENTIEHIVGAGTYDPISGNFLVIYHGHGLWTLYAHCYKLKVKIGDRVKKGQVIAIIGQTGYAFGPHLHFGVLKKVGNTIERVNPLDYVSQP